MTPTAIYTPTPHQKNPNKNKKHNNQPIDNYIRLAKKSYIYSIAGYFK